MSASKNELIAILTFRLADQFYALPIMNVLEVAAMMTLSTMPDSPPAIIGMINRHGEALPVLDLRVAFNLQVTAPDETTLFIVAQSEIYQLGLIVDEIFQVKYVNETMYKESHGAGSHITHIISDGQSLYQQIDLHALLKTYLTRIQS